MNMYMGLQIIMILLLLVTLVYVAYTAFARWQGDMHFIAVPAGTAPLKATGKVNITRRCRAFYAGRNDTTGTGDGGRDCSV